MNGLDPAGMHEMRDMIRSLVAEGRTVVLSSHLLDEVQRTCDAVAIVDRGNVIRQGPIAELLAGTRWTLQVDCSEPDRARALLAAPSGAAPSTSRPTDWRSRCRPARRATSSPRSPGSWSPAGSRCIGCNRCRPRSSRGSCRSPADWAIRNDDHARRRRIRGRRRSQSRARSPWLADPDRRDDRDQVHGAAQAPRPDDHLGRW